MNRTSSLTTRMTEYLQERGELDHRRAAGLEAMTSVEALAKAYEDLSSVDTFQAALEPLGKGEEEARRARLVASFVFDRVQERALQQASGEIEALESLSTIETVDELTPFREALTRSMREPVRLRRVSLERGVNRFLREHTEPYAKRCESAIRTAHRLGYESPVALQETLQGRKFAELAEEAERCLRQTEDAYRDLLGYMLHKIDARLRPLPSGDAQRHDLAYACLAPTWAGLFRTEPFLRALSRWLEEAGFSPTAGGHLRVDGEERPNKPGGVSWAVLRAPEDIRLTFRPASHAPHAAAILRGLGQALSRALASVHLPPEYRWLGDRSVTQGYGLVFSHLLCEAGWVERYLELPAPAARELARHFAFDAMRNLRRRCAKLAYELALHRRGPSEELEEEFGERMRKALFVDVPSGHYLREAGVAFEDAHTLVGESLAGTLHPFLLDRFNEDYWRNPSAARWLQGLFARGGEPTAHSLCEGMRLPAPSLEPAAARLMRVMGN